MKTFLKNFLQICNAATESNDGYRCMIAPHPDLKKKIDNEVKKLKAGLGKSGLLNKIKIEEPWRPGLNDGLIYPGNMFPAGTSADIARSAGLSKAPLRGTVRVIVVLVDFSDHQMAQSNQHFHDLFFSLGVINTGSVREYYREVTNNLIDIQGEVVGPFRMPKKLSEYANGASGMGNTLPNARTMAKDAAVAANPSVNFAQYDNDGDGFVDAFIVIHAGTGAETNNNPNDIWSHKWVLDGGPYTADGSTKIYAYLTVPEDCRLGVCAHELGHLLFGFPDLYDTDYSSEGIGNWCLMAGGSWNNGGLTPAHPSAWCKCKQGWVTTEKIISNRSNVAIEDVKTGYKVYRLWKDGADGNEYFLVENRQRQDFDKNLPNGGLLIWHIDDSVADNSNESHYKVALMQADGKKDLENGTNRGDGGDSYPGNSNNATFDSNSNPNSKSYGNVTTCVAVKNISAPGTIMHADLFVKCGVKKDFIKDHLKDIKEHRKEIRKELHFEKIPILDKVREKSLATDKGFKEIKEKDKDLVENKIQDVGGLGGGFPTAELSLEQRVAYLESLLSSLQPFITGEMRPEVGGEEQTEENG